MTGFPQLTKSARLYMYSVPVAGTGVLFWALTDLYLQPPPPIWLALAALTVLTGSFTVKIPGLVARLSVSEPFVFAATFLFGPSVGAVTAALDAFIMSLWLLPNLKTFHRISFNLSVLIISIWVSSQLFFWLSGIDSRSPSYESLGDFIVPLYAFTLSCFLLNSGLIAVALACERRQSAFSIWRHQFLWLSLNYFGGASVAALLVLYAKRIDLAVLGIIIPLLVISYLTFRTTLGRLDDANSHVGQLNNLYLSTIETLAMAVDAKDQVTHGHIRRVQRYAVGLANALGVGESNQLKAIEAAALLHDMGKLAIPEYILNKPGRLTELEFEKMKLHAGIGAEILSAVSFPYPVVPIVRHHHENWDGTGYPDRLRDVQIPLGARILSVVDCFDALTSDRPYRPALSTQDALQIVMARRGTMYDPLVVDTFVTELPQLSDSLADVDPQSETMQKITDLNNPTLGLGRQDNTEEVGSTADPTSLLSLLSSSPGNLDLSDLILILFGRLRNLMSIDGCVIYLTGPSSDGLVVAGVAGSLPDGFLGAPIEYGSRIAGWVAANRTPVRNSDPELDLGRSARSLGLRNALACPLLYNNELRGVISLYSQSKEGFSGEHQRLVELLAPQICEFLSQLPRSIHITQRGSAQPPVASWLELRDMWAQPRTTTEAWFPVSILTISALAAAPDTARLESMLRAIRGGVRLGDCLFCLSENLFVVLLLRSTEETAANIERRLRLAFAESVSLREVTLSIGSQTISEHDRRLDDIVGTARAASVVAEALRSKSVH